MQNDILSDVLKTVRLSGAVFFDVATHNPWVAAAPPASAVAELVLPGSQHVLQYHVVTNGQCWATLLDSNENAVCLTPGSVIMFPQGDRHVMASSPELRTVPDLSDFNQPLELSPPYYLGMLGEGPEDTRLLCGFLGCDALPFNPLIQALPRMVHIPGAYTAGNGWLSSLIQAIIKESRQRRGGGNAALARLSELIFIEVVRSYMESLPTGTVGWIAALADHQLARAIHLLHANCQKAWTLESLAKEAGMSRTVLVNRFSSSLGMAPMTYLGNWRMQKAASSLAGGAASILQIAAEVGYESEAAFGKAFKRHTGISPGAWRSRHSAKPA